MNYCGKIDLFRYQMYCISPLTDFVLFWYRFVKLFLLNTQAIKKKTNPFN